VDEVMWISTHDELRNSREVAHGASARSALHVKQVRTKSWILSAHAIRRDRDADNALRGYQLHLSKCGGRCVRRDGL